MEKSIDIHQMQNNIEQHQMQQDDVLEAVQQQDQANVHGEIQQNEMAEVPQIVAQMPAAADIQQVAEEGHMQEANRSEKLRYKMKQVRVFLHVDKEEDKPLRLAKDLLNDIEKQEKRAIKQAKSQQGTLAPGTIPHEQWFWYKERVAALDAYANSLPEGSYEKRIALKKKEEMQVKADTFRRLYKVSIIENKEERVREQKTWERHLLYDIIKKRVKADNPLAHEGAKWKNPQNGHMLVNIGRAFMGGTKPMYIFEDRQAPIVENGQVVGYKKYLFKEAVNCLGAYKPEGAIVTEAAAKLQEKICGEYSIPAVAVEKDGKVLGSFQEKIETWQQTEGKVDLFSWQAHPQDSQLPDTVKTEVLREHTLDWLLCNFDTKGENFLQRTDGHLCSFDKEASFGKIFEQGAQQMSTTYKPHANDTIYNVLFTEFAEGRVSLDLDSVMRQIQIVQGIADNEYLEMFRGMLDQKYGIKGKNRRKAEEAILARKNNLEKEYRRFFGTLILRRKAALEKAGKPNDYADRLDKDNGFIFQNR